MQESDNENKLYLYNVYRGMTEEHYPYAAGVYNSLKLFADKHFYNPEDPNTIVITTRNDDESTKHVVGFGYDNFILPLYREGIALAHVFGNQYAEEKMGEKLTKSFYDLGINLEGTQLTTWQDIYKNILKTTTPAERNFDELSGKAYVYAAFEAVRLQSALVFLHDKGEISDEQFHGALKAVDASMDRLGLNGIERLLETRPELEDVLATDTRKMFLTTEHRRGVRESYHSFDQKNQPAYVDELYKQWLERGRYYTLMRDNVCKSPIEKKRLIRRMMGDEYLSAYNDRVDTFRSYRYHKQFTLNPPIEELLRVYHDESASEEEKDRCYKTLLINYGLGQGHERIQDIRDRFRPTPSQGAIGNTPLAIPQTAGQEPGEEPAEKKSPGGSEELESGGTTSSTGSKSPGGGYSGGYSSSSSSPGFDDDKRGMIASSILTTAIAGAVIGDSIRRVSQNKKTDEKEKQNTNLFWLAVESVVAIVGIAVVWMSHEAIGKFFSKTRG